MGKGGGSTTIGFKYFLGLHSVLCKAPVDGLLKVRMGGKVVWTGFKESGQFQVFKEELFGGKKEEGGVSGFVDVESGRPDQTANSYLSARFGAENTPAFRGVFALVWRQFYFGNSAYIKPWQALVRNVFSTYGNFLPSLAPINTSTKIQNCAVYVALDRSGSMDTANRDATSRAAVLRLFENAESLDNVSCRVQGWGSSAGAASRYTNYDFKTSDLTALETFLDGLGFLGGTDFSAAVAGAPDFFAQSDNINKASTRKVYTGFFGALAGALTDKLGPATTIEPIRKVLVLITDGDGQFTDEAEVILNSIPDLEVWCFAIAPDLLVLGQAGGDLEQPNVGFGVFDDDKLQQLDNTPSDGVPSISEDNLDSLDGLIGGMFSSFSDLNPVHILIDVLLDPELGGSGDITEIGDSFVTAAQTLFDENFGLSLGWENTEDRDSFKKLVEDHIGAFVFLDRQTGKWEIKLVRPDYTVGDLFTFDKSNVVEWMDVDDPQQHELPNQITIVYTRRSDGEPQSVQVTNSAAVVTAGRIIPEKIEYEGITTATLASKVAQRELVSRSKGGKNGSFKAAYVPADLNLGSPVILDEPRMNLNQTVVRITEIEEPDGVDNSVVIRFQQDVYAVDPIDDPVVADEVVLDIDEPDAVTVPAIHYAFELPYWYLVLDQGQVAVDELLASDPDAGFFVAGVTAAGVNVRSTTIQSDEGSPEQFQEVAAPALAPVWSLLAPLSADASVTTFTALETGDESEIEINQLMQIDDELVSILSLSSTDGVITFTVSRAVADTVPQHHNTGALAYVWQDYGAGDGTEYTLGETLKLQTLAASASEQQDIDDVEPIFVTFDGRASKPYPVGKLQIDAEYLPTGVQTGTLTATWAHRDRTIQTTTTLTPHTDGNIGPETGVSYIPQMWRISLRDDAFAGDDWFEPRDFFLDPTPTIVVDFPMSPDQATTFDFDVDTAQPDFFDLVDVFDESDWFADAISDRVLRFALGVKTVRGVSDEYENHQTPSVAVSPLLPVINLQGFNV